VDIDVLELSIKLKYHILLVLEKLIYLFAIQLFDEEVDIVYHKVDVDVLEIRLAL